MGDALKEFRNYYGLYLRDGVPGLVLIVFGVALTWESGLWEDLSIKSDGKLSLNAFALQFISWLFIVSLLLAPAVGLILNQLSLVLFLDRLLDSARVRETVSKILTGPRHSSALNYWVAQLRCKLGNEAANMNDHQIVFNLETIASTWLQEHAKEDWYSRETISGAYVLQRSLILIAIIASMLGVMVSKNFNYSWVLVVVPVLFVSAAGTLAYRRYFTISRYGAHSATHS